VAVAYTARLIQQRGGPAFLASVAAASIACADWLFVSLGWLAYFDSWSVLGLLVATFSPSRFALCRGGPDRADGRGDGALRGRAPVSAGLE